MTIFKVDYDGSETYTLSIKDTATGKLLDDVVEDKIGRAHV